MGDAQEAWEGEGFGLGLRSSYRILGLSPGLPSRLPLVSLSLSGAYSEANGQDDLRHGSSEDEHDPLQAGLHGRVLRDIRHPNGSLGMSIEQAPGGDYRILAPQFGTHVVDAAGTNVSSLPLTGLEPWRWQRLLIGQVLPLLAALRGYEVLHAAAVAVEGVAFGLVGDPGAGKSTLAASLTLRGQRLLSDDVLAVSLDSSGAALAHRGSLTLTLRNDQLDLADNLIDRRAAERLGSEDKQMLALDPKGTPELAPLGALYLLSRDEGEPVGEPRTASVLDLMRFSYIRYVQSPARLAGQLELQAGIAGSVPVVPVRVSTSDGPATLAARLESHMRELAAARLSR
jgi:hypothetical protein